MTIFLVSPNHTEARKVLGWDDTPCFSEHEIQSKCQTIMSQFENDNGYKCEAYYFSQSIESILSTFVFQKGLPLVDFNAFRATIEEGPVIGYEDIPPQLLDPITLLYTVRHDVYNYRHAPKHYYGDLVDQAILMVDNLTSILTDVFTELNTLVNSEGKTLSSYTKEYSIELNKKMATAILEVGTFKVSFTGKIQDLLREQEQVTSGSNSTDSESTDLSSFEEELIFSPPTMIDEDDEYDFDEGEVPNEISGVNFDEVDDGISDEEAQELYRKEIPPEYYEDEYTDVVIEEDHVNAMRK